MEHKLYKCIPITPKTERVTTALLLAAGTGSRLAPLTDMLPKCLVKLNGISILERMVDSLKSHGFKRLVIVVGHLEESIRDFLGNHAGGIEITYISNPLYKTTNNIYSLWLARKAIDEPFLLLESDVVYSRPLKHMLWPDQMAIGHMKQWMNGTTVTIDSHQEINAFWASGINSPNDMHYKTVNMYSLSRYSWNIVRQRLEQHISNNKVNGYYETVFSELVAEGSLHFTPVLFGNKRWFEIDTLDDLHEAEQLFPRHVLAPIAKASTLPFHRSVQSAPVPMLLAKSDRSAPVSMISEMPAKASTH